MDERLDVIDELERRLIDSCYRSRPRYVRVRDRRTWIPAAGLAVAAAVVVAVVAAVLPGGAVSPTSALAALRSAASAAARGDEDGLGPGKAWYVRIVMAASYPAPQPVTPASGPSTATLSTRYVRQVWMTRDGATTTRGASQDTIGGVPESTSPPTTEHSPGRGVIASPLFPVPLFSYARLRALPANTGALLRVVRQIQKGLHARALKAAATAPAPLSTHEGPPATTTSGVTTTHHGGRTTYTITATGTVVGRCCGTTPAQHGTVSDLNAIAWLLALPVTPQVRAALYRAAAKLPGVRYDGTRRDALGRRGVEISLGTGDDQMRMIFDPHTGALLASSMSFGASALAKGFGPLLETVAVEKVVRTQP